MYAIRTDICVDQELGEGTGFALLSTPVVVASASVNVRLSYWSSGWG
jgi:hypothetical protein